MQLIAKGRGNIVNGRGQKDGPRGRRKKLNVTKLRQQSVSRRQQSPV